jgi:N-acetylglucosaminyldiphosphoundecaprenol N-acetyl-beta-D-mannosaminyltransferase
LAAPVLVGVGAAFDFFAGRVSQAPKWMQSAGLEWLYRVTQDPARLGKRYLMTLPKFVALVLAQRRNER